MDKQPPQESQERMMREFLEYQKQELANKSKELDIRRDEVQSNERIALASIQAQKSDSDNRGTVFTETVKSRNRTLTWLALIAALVVIAAMLTDKTDVALELIKVGGAVILGYIAGVNKGKAQALEQRRPDQAS
ncbi:TPA: hypothetical protein ACFN7P_001231 [Neisseria meningitidis]|uniref:Membrane protein n=1 Tax=Neisseria meningitidis TaxID=487 RepID=A0AB33TXJ8_NEIME|nr:hypothetical protein [Neisseria meningitidis]MCV6653142.1 hypothetical protein [Neisseria meningitidis]MCV6672818.1 hypothetical protein [Neisseria meningitidis]MCV6749984.1 hypothetical protein [Neisseria meningitidis]CWN41576.1 membrane protein [Neisseria meningitidis]CWQ00058.1 membrane protein [Neisseria meningitidis]